MKANVVMRAWLCVALSLAACTERPAPPEDSRGPGTANNTRGKESHPPRSVELGGTAGRTAAPAIPDPVPGGVMARAPLVDGEREVQPESIAGLATEPWALTKDRGATCRGVMTEGQLCTCVSGLIKAEFPDAHAATCTLLPLSVPGFALFADRYGLQYLLGRKDGGVYWLTQLEEHVGSPAWHALDAKLSSAGELTVLSVELRQNATYFDGEWEYTDVSLCALRELADPQFGRCVKVRLESTEVAGRTALRYRATYQLTDRGTVVVRGRGRSMYELDELGAGERPL